MHCLFARRRKCDESSPHYSSWTIVSIQRVKKHGIYSFFLFQSGSKRNWASICKAFHRDMPERPIYALDLRNHGSSPHALPMTYESMASDVRKFVEDKQLKNIVLLGHSM